MRNNMFLVAGVATVLTLATTTAFTTFATESGASSTDTNTAATDVDDAWDKKLWGWGRGGHKFGWGMFGGMMGGEMKWAGWNVMIGLGHWGKGKWMHLMGVGGPFANNQAAQDALTKNDYNAFVAATKWTKLEGKVTQEQFTTMVARTKQHTAVQTALTASDYSAFTAAITWTPMEGNVTQEQFTKMVTMHKKHAAIQDAVKNNDYNAFVKASTPTQEEFAEIVKNFNDRQAQEQNK